jgi:hypothetical protein
MEASNGILFRCQYMPQGRNLCHQDSLRKTVQFFSKPKNGKGMRPWRWSPVRCKQSWLVVLVRPADAAAPGDPSCSRRPGFGFGAFFSLMSASFAYEDPFLRQRTQAGLNTTQKAREIFRDMGKGMWSTGKGFGKVGALFAGIECVIESVRSCMHRSP